MDLLSRLVKLKELAEGAGIDFQPALMPETVAERTGRRDLALPDEIAALYRVCDGAELGTCVSLMPLSSYMDVRRMLIEIAGETDQEEWLLEYHPFADFNGSLVLCLEAASGRVCVLDVECSVVNDVAPSIEALLGALEMALESGGIAEAQGGRTLPGWEAAAHAFGIGEVWSTGMDEAEG